MSHTKYLKGLAGDQLIPLRKIYSLASQRMRAIAEELNPPVGDVGMTDEASKPGRRHPLGDMLSIEFTPTPAARNVMPGSHQH
jgi:hypothetical protein